MNLNRKKAPGRLSRAIVALAASTGKKLTWIRNNDRAPEAARAKEFNRATEEYEGQLRFSERTTITVETERLLIVRSERRSSTARAECRSENQAPRTQEQTFLAPEERDVYSRRKKLRDKLR